MNEEILSLQPQQRTAPTGPTLGEVFDRSYRRLVVQLYGTVGDIYEAEDLVQEAFVRAAAAANRFLRADNHEAWLRTTAINLHRNRWRKLRNFAKIRHRPAQPTDLEGLEEHLAVVAALRNPAESAPPGCRAVLPGRSSGGRSGGDVGLSGWNREVATAAGP